MTYKLYDHQQKAVDHILRLGGNGALFLSIGMGKCLTTLTIYKTLKEKDPSLKMLVVCPLSLINTSWRDDCHKFYPDFKFQNLRDKKISDADIYLINFESYRLDKYQKQIKDIAPGMVAIDESSKIRNIKSLIAKTLLKNKANYKYKMVLSGSPVANTELDYFCQISFVSDVFPDSYYKFRNIYFELSRGKETYHGTHFSKFELQNAFKKGFSYRIKQSKRQELMDTISKVAFTADKEKCLDLPEEIHIIREVTLSSSQMKVYKDFKKYMVTEIKDQMLVATVALTVLVKCRQLSSGFAITEGGEPTNLVDNSKLRELDQVLNEVGCEQAIIWITFRHEVTLICDLLDKRGQTYSTLYSQTKDRDLSISDFKAGNSQFLIAHGKSGAHGLNLTNCSLQIFFSFDYSWETRIQQLGRTRRIGAVNTCRAIYLMAKDTLDFDIHKALQEKKTIGDFVNDLLR